MGGENERRKCSIRLFTSLSYGASFYLPRFRLAALAKNGRTSIYQPAIEQIDGPGFVRWIGTKGEHDWQENSCR
jgi:hypothetical protein